MRDLHISVVVVALFGAGHVAHGATDVNVFGLLNPNYPCAAGDDGRAGACNKWMLERFCDIGYRLNDASPGEGETVINTETLINFGFMAPFSGPDALPETTSHMGLLCAVERVNLDPTILPGVEYRPIFGDTIGIQAGATAAALCLHEVGLRMFVGPSFSGAATGAATVAKIFKTPIIGTTPSTPALADRGSLFGFPTFSRLMPSDTYQGKAIALLMQEFDWSRTIVLSLANDEYADGVVRAFTEEASDLRINIVRSITFSRASLANDVDAILKDVITLGVRVVLLVGYIPDARQVLTHAKTLGMLNEGWAWIGSDSWITDASFSSEDMGVDGLFGLVPHVETESNEWKNLTSCYRQHKDDTTGMFGNLSWVDPEPNWISAYMYDATLHLAMSLESLRANRTASGLEQQGFLDSLPNLKEGSEIPLLEEIRSLKFEGATGNVALDFDGERRGEAEYDIINIRRGHANRVVGNIIPQKFEVTIPDLTSLMFPGGVNTPPLSLVETCVIGKISDAGNILGLVLVVIGTLIAAACATFNYVWRLNKIVRVSAWRVNLLTITGCFIVYISLYAMSWDAKSMVSSCSSVGAPLNYTDVADEEYSRAHAEIDNDIPCFLGTEECVLDAGLSICASRMWLFGIGYTLTFGSLFAKTYRITKLFGSSAAVATKIGDKQVFIYILVQVLPMVVFLLAWTIGFPMHLHYEPVKKTIDGPTVGIILDAFCDGEQHYGAFNIVFVFYCLAMLLLGAFLAWSVKDVWIKEVNDSSAVAMCIYTILIIGGLGYAVVVAIEDREEAYLAAVLSGWLCNTLVLVILFVPKMYEVYQRRHESDIKLGAGPERVGIHSIAHPDPEPETRRFFLARRKRDNRNLTQPELEYGRDDDLTHSLQNLASSNPMYEDDNSRNYMLLTPSAKGSRSY